MQKKASYIVLAIFTSLLAVGCSDRFDAYTQSEIDKKLIENFISTHSLTPSGGISTTASAPAGSIPLIDTAKRISSAYIVHTEKGKGIKPNSKSPVMIRYEGFYLETLQQFTKNPDDPKLFKLYLDGAIEALKAGIVEMNTASYTPPDQYDTPGQAWIILPSAMGFGNNEIKDPPVPANTCLVYKITLYRVADL